MKNILYLTDFSANSEHALGYALELARLFNARLTLFNGYQITSSRSSMMVSVMDRLAEDSINDLNAIKERILKDPQYQNLNIIVDSRPGNFISLIPQLVKKYHSDLIVMGAKGRSAIAEVFMGSSTMGVIRSSVCPVLAVPENAINAQERRFNKIAFAVDLNPIPSKKVIRPLFEIAKVCNSPIEFVNIVKEGESEDDQYRKEAMENIKIMAHDVSISFHFSNNEDIIDGLSGFINHKKPDLFVMVSKKHTLFERIFTQSITNQLSFRTEVPLLVLSD